MIVATCRDEVAELRSMGIDPGKVTVVPCGVDLDLFTPPPRPAIGTPRSPLRLLSVGRLVERKGVDTVLHALAGLPEAELVIAGGPTADRLSADPEAARLLGLARDLGVDDRVAMVGGVDHRAVPDLFRSADVAVCTPWYE